MDERKLRLYKFLLKMGRIKLEDIPEEYREALEEQSNIVGLLGARYPETLEEGGQTLQGVDNKENLAKLGRANLGGGF